MRGILIDPFARTVTEIEVGDGIDSIYNLIQASLFDVVHLTQCGETIYVDDEGLSVSNQAFFCLDPIHTPLAGRALILGTDLDTGESRGSRLSLEAIRHHVQFLDWHQALEMAEKADQEAEELLQLQMQQSCDDQAEPFDAYVHVPIAPIIAGAYPEASDEDK